MPVKRPDFQTDGVYHIIIRGVGDSFIFKNESDYFRGIFSLYEFNDERAVIMRERRKKHRERFYVKNAKRSLLTKILAFCLMPNHIHLLLRPIKKNGISDFIRKVGAGYVGYFNLKYNRKGPLFAKYRAVTIKDNGQLKTVFVYIHTNPIATIEPGWKEEGIKNKDKAISLMDNYRWSSYLDYLGKDNFPSLTSRNFLFSVFGKSENCKNLVIDWINYKSTKNRSM